MNDPGIALNLAQFKAAFPFHFAFDHQLRLLQIGSKLESICSSARPGALVIDLMKIIRPEVMFSWNDIQNNLSTLFLIECPEAGVTLRGQMIPMSDSECILFLGSPWFTDASEVVSAGLTFDDFAIHDPGIDMLLALQTQKMGYLEVKTLAAELSKQRAELRSANGELQARNDALQAARDALHQSSDDLRSTASRLAALVRNLHQGVIVEDQNGKIVLSNELFCGLFDLPIPPDALIGVNCRDAGREAANLFSDREQFLNRVNEILAEQKNVIGEELSLVSGRIYSRDYVPVMDNKSCIGHLWAYRDVTPQKRVERDLRAERNLLSITLSSMADGVITVDRYQKVKLMNSVAMDLTGWRMEQAAGRMVDEVMILKALNGDPAPCPIARSFFQRERVGDVHLMEGLHTLHSHSGGRYSVVTSATPFFSPEGDIVGGIVLLRDVTTESQIEMMKRSFVDNVSHELKTPLTAIQGFVTNLQQESEMTPSIRQEFLGIIRDQTQRLATLVEDILDLSRIESGEGHFQDQFLHLEEVVRRSMVAMIPQAKAKNIDISFIPARHLPKLFADPTRMESVISNLICNAVKFTPNGGLVSVGLDSNGLDVLLTVRDTGAGIPQDQQTRIFRKFYRVQRPGTAVPGTGLGLSIVHGIVQHYGGRIEVESQEQKGSCFRVYLPLRLKVSESPSSTASSL